MKNRSNSKMLEEDVIVDKIASLVSHWHHWICKIPPTTFSPVFVEEIYTAVWIAN